MIIYGEGLYKPGTYVELYKALTKHRDYGTLEVLTDDRGISAVGRFNHITPELVFIIDVVCREDVRNKKALRELIENGIKKNPDIKYISYDRGIKYPNKTRKTFKVSEFLRRS